MTDHRSAASGLTGIRLFDSVAALLSESFDIPRMEIRESSRLTEDLHIDQIDIDYFALVLETRFELDIASSSVEKLKTVSDVMLFVSRKRSP